MVSSDGGGNTGQMDLAAMTRAGGRRDVEATNLADLYDLPLFECSAIEERLARGVAQVPGGGATHRRFAVG